MPLRRTLEALPETMQEMELASVERFREAETVWAAGCGGPAIYLFGYSAEMLLKTAYFRVQGARPPDLVGPMLGPARAAGKVLCPDLDPEHYHSIRFWAALLRLTRRDRNPLPALIDAPLVQRTRRLYQNWWVEMRYRRDYALERQVATVHADVSWLHEHHSELWR